MLGGPWTRAGQVQAILEGLRHLERLVEIERRYRDGANTVKLFVPSAEKLAELADAAYLALAALKQGAPPVALRRNVRLFSRGVYSMRMGAEGAITGYAAFKERHGEAE